MFFKEFVQQGSVKNPIQRGFSLSKWTAAWRKCEHDDTGEMLYEAGIAFDGILSEIRSELNALYKIHAPKLKNKDLLRFYCALPNRDRVIAAELAFENLSQVKNIFSQTTDNNPAGNHLTFPEIADGCVDALQKAIAQCVTRIKEGKEIIVGEDPVDPIEFVKSEADLSQAYGIFEEYWAALQWGDYRFEWLDKERKIAKIEQQLSHYEVAFEVSNIRRMRLTANLMNEVAELLDAIQDTYVTSVGSGKQRDYRAIDISEASSKIKHLNAVFNLEIGNLYDIYPEEILRAPYFASGVCIIEMLEIFRILSLLSVELSDRYPSNSSIVSSKKLAEYATIHNKNKLCSIIARALSLSYEKVRDGLVFLTYIEATDDIWCHPILRPENNQLIFLTAALVTPNVLRVVEHWLVKLEVNISVKGYIYEKNLVNELNESVAKNKFVTDWDRAQSTKVRINGNEEEIDLLIRVGSVVIVGEAKSIVGPYSTTAFHRTWQTLRRAAAQAQRKSNFVRDNIKEIFDRLDMNYDPSVNYVFMPLVINSNRMFAGFMVDGVSICDDAILLAYFNKNEFPLLSTIKNGKPVHHAWLEVYNCPDTLEKNLTVYFENLPQVSETAESFEIKPAYVPQISEKSAKVIYSRAVMKEISLQDRLERKYPFPLKTAPDIGTILSEVEIVI